MNHNNLLIAFFYRKTGRIFFLNQLSLFCTYLVPRLVRFTDFPDCARYCCTYSQYLTNILKKLFSKKKLYEKLNIYKYKFKLYVCMPEIEIKVVFCCTKHVDSNLGFYPTWIRSCDIDTWKLILPSLLLIPVIQKKLMNFLAYFWWSCCSILN